MTGSDWPFYRPAHDPGGPDGRPIETDFHKLEIQG
jgi:hypothetical protein